MNENQQATPVTQNITLGQDGVYRWAYELKLLKNPTVLITVLTIFGGILVGFLVVSLLFSIGDIADDGWSAVIESLKLTGLMGGLLMGLTILGYLFYALTVGGKYLVLFEMDEKGIKHIQAPKQLKKTQMVSAIAALSGAATGNYTAAGAGLLAASKNASASRWDKVKSISVHPTLGVIKVNEALVKNQIYAEKSDFPFVRDYILSHCSGAKIKQ